MNVARRMMRNIYSFVLLQIREVITCVLSGFMIALGPSAKSGTGQPQAPAGFRDGDSGIIQYDNHVIFSSAFLLSPCGPFAISRFIPLGIINSVYRQSWRTVAHIIKERLKGMPPSITYLYSGTAVSFISICVRVLTSLYHRSPKTIHGRAAHVMNCQAFISLNAYLSTNASA